ncbi:MAG: phospho-N-acetylmuramoyl-pentapeptide-transferase [Clostridium sp.]|nr:phospho-N-acetylmuramoyl-pentapeptide-transferase [Clostridium sp.]
MIRALLALFSGLLMTLFTGQFFIKKLHSFKFGQNIRQDGPESHLKKQGIPSMGGVIFLFALTLIALTFSLLDLKILFMITVTLSFGLIGFLDDYLKVKKKSSDGLSAKHKMVLLLIFGLVAGIILYLGFDHQGIVIPYLNKEINLGLFYILFVVIFFAAVTNAVNLTDGIDGLSTSVTISVVVFYALIALRLEDMSILLFSMTLIGSLLGFLGFNKYPAKVFMGDSGSLALGGAVGILALLTKTELLLILIGIIYVLETLSVIIQVGYFKLTGKRVFKMAPIHHHFEALGWKEQKIVGVFTSITVIMVLLVYFTLS